MPHDIKTINDKVDLVYSPDESGWYFQENNYPSMDRISQLFPTKPEAYRAWNTNTIEWHKL